MKLKPRVKSAKPSAPRRFEAAIAKANAEPEIRYEDPSDYRTWGLEQTIGHLTSQGDIVTAKDVTGKTVRARRDDIFRTLRNTKSGDGTVLTQAHIHAIDRLHGNMALRNRETGASHVQFAINGGGGSMAIEDVQIMAGERVDQVLAMTGKSSADLIVALLLPPDVVRLVDGERLETESWRATVAKITGVTNAAAQPGQIKMACENLVGAFAAYDKLAVDEVSPYARRLKLGYAV
jgi:hypothetical protein